MPIDPSGMVMRLNPVQGLDLTGFSRALEQQQQLQAERERLRMQREQLDEQRRYHAEQSELRKMEEQGAMARQQLQLQQQREKAEADQLAKLTEQRRAAQAEARKYMVDRDAEAVEAMLPEMNQLGMLAERQGEGVYRIEQDRAAFEQQQADAAAQQAAAEDAAWQGAPRPLYDSLDGAQPEESAEQSLAQMNQLGYPTNERGNLDDPSADRGPLLTDETLMAAPEEDPELDEATADALMPGDNDYVAGQDNDPDSPPPPIADVSVPRGMGPALISSGDAYAQALAAGEYGRRTKQPLKGPDAPDEMGAVPNNVYDMDAMKSQAVRRLNPALQALVDAQPDAYKASTEATNEAARQVGIGGVKGLELADKLRAGPDANLRSELAAERAVEKEERELQTEKPLSLKDQTLLRKDSRVRAEKIANERGIPDVYSRVKPAAMIKAFLSDEEGSNDDAILFQLSKMLGSVGAQSNADLRVAASIDAEATIDQAIVQLHRWFKGGNPEERNKVLMGIVDKSLEGDKAAVFDYLEALDKAIDGAHNEYEAEGLQQAREAVPSVYLEAYDAQFEDEEEEEPAERQGVTVDAEGNPVQPTAGSMEDDDEFMEAIHTAAEDAGLDADLILPSISAESRGGDPTAKNPGSSARGLIQFLDSTARGYTNPRTGKKFSGSAELAQLTRAEQAPIVIDYLKRNGVTSEHDQGDIYVAISAPGYLNAEDDAEVYKEGTDDYAKNAHNWDLDNDGVITRGELYRWGMGERKKAGAAPKAKAEAPAPGGNVLKRLSPTGGAAEAATDKSRSDSEIDALTAD